MASVQGEVERSDLAEFSFGYLSYAQYLEPLLFLMAFAVQQKITITCDAQKLL